MQTLMHRRMQMKSKARSSSALQRQFGIEAAQTAAASGSGSERSSMT